MSSVVIGAPVMVVAAVGVVGCAIACSPVLAAVACSQLLAKEYQRARHELDEQLAAQHARQDAAYAAQQQKATEAQELIALTRLTIDEDATLAFLRNGIEKLHARLTDIPDIDPQMPKQLQELGHSIDVHPDLHATHIKQFYELSAIVSQAADRKHTATTSQGDGSTLATILDELIRSPLLASKACAPLRETVAAERARIEHLPASEHKVRQQCYRNLIRRVKDEISEQARQEQRRMQSVRAFRERVYDVQAKLTAVTALHDLPEYVRQAECLRTQLAQQLANASIDNLEVIHHLAQQADELYTQAPHALETQLKTRYLHEQVCDVLVSMGYKVTTVPPESVGAVAVLLEVDADTGIQVSMDSQGRLVTEMVATNEDAAICHADTQERVCNIVDDIFTHLETRGSQVKVKSRKKRKSGERLRVVTLTHKRDEMELQRTDGVAKMRRIGE